MTPPRPLLDLVRFAPARPALASGLRAGAAAVLPLVASPVLPPETISWVSLGGFLAALVDKGGAYRTRAATMAAVLLFGGLAAFLGTAAGGSLGMALPLAFVWLLGAGLAQAGGAAAASAGTLTAVILVVALARPAPSLAAALDNGGAVAAGALWAMALALLLWPVRLYRPARFALARCWEALAEHACSLADAPAGDVEERAQRLHAQRALVRSHVEEARRILIATRRGRQAESERGERLLVLIENADQLLGACIAIDGWQESAAPGDRARVAAVLARLAESARSVGTLLRSDGRSGGPVPPIVGGAPPMERGTAGRLVGRLARHFDGVIEAANGLATGGALPRPAATSLPLEVPSVRRRPAELLGLVVDGRSVILRHALRLALAGTAAAAAASLLRLDHGYWITVTVVAILQPWTGASVQRGLQRIGGTALGALIAVGAVALVDHRAAFAAIVFLLCSASVALLPLNYGVFSVLLTPAFVLLAELGTGDYGLAWVRVVDTLIGGGIALLAARLLWPSWERHRFPEELAAALRSSAAWMRLLGTGGPETGPTEKARRQVGIAVLNAEASLQRLLSEAWSGGEELEALAALTLYLRRLHATALALFSDPGLEAAARQRVGSAAGDFLDEMAAALAEGRAPADAELPPALEELGEGQGPLVERLVRQLSIVHGAAMRAFAGGAFALQVTDR